MTATVYISGSKGGTRVLALIDQGSQRSFILDRIMAELGINRKGEEELSICPFGSNKIAPITVHQLFELQVKGENAGAKETDIVAYGVTNI